MNSVFLLHHYLERTLFNGLMVRNLLLIVMSNIFHVLIFIALTLYINYLLLMVRSVIVILNGPIIIDIVVLT